MTILSLVSIGLIWGVTNALIKRGALIAEERKNRRSGKEVKEPSKGVLSYLYSHCQEWIYMLSLWQYSLPFFVNLSASALFFITLSHTPITLAVPVTNAITFGATAAAGMALGEKMHGIRTLVGIVLITAGVWICISASNNPESSSFG
ncbi:hypothetical protein GOP47_0021978 [Adiantum capillus-veneris]|uniref:Transmembrane protein 234 homolog n=1 Tax=Adiantum capillus-veneris TaxID=13818 RepID=A0A9D4Z8C9_ADICA|nr:hypothetical protein GOP47_0021978 [Adiantum capillus-veneris]